MVKTKCEVYSRVCGYLRPVEQWNEGKQAEFNDRKTFNLKPEFKEREEEKVLNLKLKEVKTNMANRDSTGPRSGSTGPRDGRGKGQGRAGGKGTGRKTGGKKGNC